MAKLQCPECKSENTTVYSTRQRADRVTRYRRCLDCNHTFSTIEQIPSKWSHAATIKQIQKLVEKFD